MKRLAITAGCLVVMSIFAFYAFAEKTNPQPAASCCSGNSAYESLTEQQIRDIEKIRERFLAETEPIRRQVWEKAGRLDALTGGSPGDEAKARLLREEIGLLMNQFKAKKGQFWLEVRKIVPQTETQAYNRKYGPADAGGASCCATGPQTPSIVSGASCCAATPVKSVQ